MSKKEWEIRQIKSVRYSELLDRLPQNVREKVAEVFSNEDDWPYVIDGNEQNWVFLESGDFENYYEAEDEPIPAELVSVLDTIPEGCWIEMWA